MPPALDVRCQGSCGPSRCANHFAMNFRHRTSSSAVVHRRPHVWQARLGGGRGMPSAARLNASSVIRGLPSRPLPSPAPGRRHLTTWTSLLPHAAQTPSHFHPGAMISKVRQGADVASVPNRWVAHRRAPVEPGRRQAPGARGDATAAIEPCCPGLSLAADNPCRERRTVASTQPRCCAPAQLKDNARIV